MSASGRRGFRYRRAKEHQAESGTQHDAVGGHAPEPECRDQPWVPAVEGPFIESDLDGAASGQNPDDDEKTQAPDLPAGQLQSSPGPADREVEMQEPESEAEPVPPEVHSGHVEENRIDLVGVGSDHRSILRQGDRRKSMNFGSNSLDGNADGLLDETHGPLHRIQPSGRERTES